MVKRGTSARNAGALHEREVRAHIKAFGLEPIDSNRTGYSGDDIRIADEGLGCVSIECKRHGVFAWPEWLAQAAENAGEDGWPVVVAKRRGTTKVGTYYTMMEFDIYLEILDTIADLYRKVGEQEEEISKLRNAISDKLINKEG